MKKIAFVLISMTFMMTLFAQQKDNEVLLTVEGEDVTKSEFLRVYNKNNVNNEKADDKSIEDYLQRFINFKLKVKAAEELKLDTHSAFIKELAGYREQLVKPYLNDEDVMDSIIREAYNRLNTDIRASHILIKLPKNPEPEDTLKAYKKIMEIRDKIVSGEATFKEMAIQESDDPSARDREKTGRRPFRKGNYGDLGYFTAFNMIYPFETAAYTAEIGEITQPVRTKYGYHIIKVTEKKEAMGTASVAHVFVKASPDQSKEDSIKSREKIFEAYQKIQDSVDFAEVAKEYSEDRASANVGGRIKPFRCNRIIPEFVQVITGMEIGDISEPFKSDYGWHIIKVLNLIKLGDFEDEKQNMLRRVRKDRRVNVSKEIVLQRIKKENNYTVNKENLNELYQTVDTTIFYAEWDIEKAKGLDKTLISLGDETFTQQDFAKYLQENQTKHIKKDKKIEPYLDQMLERYSEKICLNYEKSHLEEKYPEFRNLMKEYRDGMLLFEITDKKVWSKAVKDTTGLKAFYEKNKENYMWGKRIDADIYQCKNKDVAKDAYKLVEKAEKKDMSNEDILSKINEEEKNLLEIETGIFSKGDNEKIDNIFTNAETGLGDIKEEGGKYCFIKVNEILDPQPKNLDEARGIITADYQDYLEKQWVEKLRKKYEYNVNKDILKSIKQGEDKK